MTEHDSILQLITKSNGLGLGLVMSNLVMSLLLLVAVGAVALSPLVCMRRMQMRRRMLAIGSRGTILNI